MLRRLCIYLSVLAVFIVFNSTGECQDDNDVDAFVKEVYNDLIGVDLSHYDNSGVTALVTSGPVKKEAYQLVVKFRTSEVLYASHSDTTYSLKLRNPLVAMHIYCDKNFGNYKIGEDISDCFKPYPYSSTVNFISNEQILADRLIDSDLIVESLRTLPAPGTYTFRVELVLSNMKIISAESTPITLI